MLVFEESIMWIFGNTKVPLHRATADCDQPWNQMRYVGVIRTVYYVLFSLQCLSYIILNLEIPREPTILDEQPHDVAKPMKKVIIKV